jgi:hypothetical protein
MATHREAERIARRFRGRACDDQRADTEPRVVIDAGHDRRAGAVVEADPAGDVHLPQLHRPGPFPPPIVSPLPPPRHRRDQPMADQGPIDRRLRWHRIEALPAQLMTDRAWTPPGMVMTHLDDARLDHRRHLMRTRRRHRRPVHQAHHALIRVLPQPPMDRLTAHPIASRNPDHRRSVEHLVHRRHPLIHDPQLHQHDRPSRSSSERKHSPSATLMSPTNRTHRHPAAGPTVAQLPDPRPRSVTHVPEPQCQP